MKRYDMKNFEDLERIVAATLGLDRTRGSGNVHNDGDSKGQNHGGETYHLLLAECKYTEKSMRSASVKKDDFTKTENSAYRYGRIPVMATGDGDGHILAHLSLADFSRIYRGFLENEKRNQEQVQ